MERHIENHVNRFFNKSLISAASILISIMANSTFAESDGAERLKTELTPFGAIRAGNAAGTIPAWTGGIQKADIPKEFKGPGNHHIDPFPNDRPRFVITAANYKQHLNQLSAGSIALFETYPETYKIPVYPTRRTHSAPGWVADNTYKNALSAKLSEGGNGVTDAFGGIPFPIPTVAEEVIWNHLARWRGRHLTFESSEAVVQANGRHVLISGLTEVDSAFYRKGGSFAELDNLNFYFLRQIESPARLAGNATLVHEKLDQSIEPRQAWIYTAGLRRVRRAPNLSFDAPIASSEGLRTADQTDMYNGSPARYSWNIVGKKEIYIPYNNFQLGNDTYSTEQILQLGHVNPDATRWELHRVWVVEGKLKEGERNIYARRTFYVDEDSWSIALADLYDGRDQLWRVSVAHLKNFYDVPLTLSALNAFYDLQSKRYHLTGLVNEFPKTYLFSDDSPSSGKFQPAALRRLGKR